MRSTVIPALLLSLGTGLGLADTRVNLEKPDLYDLQAVGFVLPRAAEVRLEAIGRFRTEDDWWFERLWTDRSERLGAYGWLFDADRRRPVWVMGDTETSRLSRTLRRAETTLKLQPGRYELYLFSGHRRAAERAARPDRDEGRRWWRTLLSDRESMDDLRADLEECEIDLTVRGISTAELRRYDVGGESPGALLRIAGAGNSTFASRIFELDAPTRLRVYMLFEQLDSSATAADYGWIVDQANREVVWHPDAAVSRGAGGDEKNRLIDEQIELPAGRYQAYYGTDDSHSPEEFNANPPVDPYNWGLTLFPGEGPASSFRLLDLGVEAPPVIDLSGAGDDSMLQQPFRMHADGLVRLHALGEYVGRDEPFVDQAWIVAVPSGRAVWEMARGNTTGAGGAEKNRMFDGLVELPHGDYVLHYSTDGSHSGAAYNAAAPFEPGAWGARLWPGPALTAGQVEPIDESQLEWGRALVRIVAVGNDQRIRRSFSLEREQRVLVSALGEGQSGSMYDYGSLTDSSTGRTVWEMTYEATAHAGGADKNRSVETEIVLPAGDYEAVFVTDGSHSFSGWNAARPPSPMNWGMVVSRIR